MSKVICDICGTTYPETADNCPICGYSRDVTAQILAEDYEPEDVQNTQKGTSVKGGRFSSSNVRKRNKAAAVYDSEPDDSYDEQEYGKEPKKESNIFLVIVLVILIIALLSVSGLIFWRYYLPNMLSDGEEEETLAQIQEENTETTEETTEDPTIPCETLELLSGDTVELSRPGQYYLLNTQPQPVNTTDTLNYYSDDETIATVDSDGRICAVSEGTVVITITCGMQEVRCTVVIAFEEETQETSEEITEATEATGETEEATEETEEATEETESTEETEATEETTDSGAVEMVVLELNKTDAKFSAIGVTYTLTYTPADIPAEDITWTTANSNIATIENGVITTRGYGITSVYAEYQGVIVECVVRVVKE